MGKASQGRAFLQTDSKEENVQKEDINKHIENVDTSNIVTHYTDILIDHDNTDPHDTTDIGNTTND